MKKKLKLILLSTDKVIREVRDGYYKNVLSLNNTKYDKSLELFRTIDGIKVPNPQHLYAISDEKPRVGDYVYNSALNVIEKFTEFDNGLLQNKVVITTDESLVIRYDERYVDVTLSGKSLNGKLPNFTNNFIEAYITRYNSGQALEYINVEYEEFHSYNMCSIPEKHNSCRIFKVNPDNTVDVSLVRDKLYTKEEVIKFAEKYAQKFNIDFKKVGEIEYNSEDLNWIKQNL